MTVLTYSNVVQKYMLGVTLDLDFASMSSLDSRITFSRATAAGQMATHFDSTGLLRYGPHNFLWPTTTFVHTNWNLFAGVTVTANAANAPNGTLTAIRLNHVTAGTVQGGYLQNAGGAGSNPGNRGILSIYAKAGTQNFLVLGNTQSGFKYCYFNLATGVVGTRDAAGWIASGMEDAGSGWWRCWGIFTAVGGNFQYRGAEVDASTTCTSPGDIYLWGPQCEWGTIETSPKIYIPTTSGILGGPRFDYDPVTHQPLGLLIEEGRTNRAGYSQDLTNAAWVKTGITVTANQIAAPDGTTTADLVTVSASPATISDPVSVGSGLAYVNSIFAKKGTSDWIYLVGETVAAAKAWFNLNTVTLGTVEAGLTGAGIQDSGNGWVRCWVSDADAGGSENVAVGLCDADNSTTVTIGRTAYLWGAQSETATSSDVSSYIPNLGNLTTNRSDDVAALTGTNFSSWYLQPRGTFVVEFDTVSANVARGVISVDGGSAAQQIFFGVSATADPLVSITAISAQASFDLGTISAGLNKLGISYALNDVAACHNGGTVQTDTAATMPTPTQMLIGINQLSTSILRGHVRRIRFWNYALSDAALQTATT